MNTNSNIYTVVYTTIIVVVVAAVLAVASSSLKSRQEANIKAEVISQILAAAQSPETTIDAFKAQMESAQLVNLDGEKVGELNIETAEVYTATDLKKQNAAIADKSADAKLPVYILKNGIKVIPVYGAGLWGPIWGYIAINTDGTIAGACLDHASETPGLGSKIKDDPNFRAQFAGKTFDFNDKEAFSIVKGGAPEGKSNAIDAITGASMTSNGLSKAINEWVNAYKPILGTACQEVANVAAETVEETNNTEE